MLLLVNHFVSLVPNHPECNHHELDNSALIRLSIDRSSETSPNPVLQWASFDVISSSPLLHITQVVSPWIPSYSTPLLEESLFEGFSMWVRWFLMEVGFSIVFHCKEGKFSIYYMLTYHTIKSIEYDQLQSLKAPPIRL